MMIVIIILVILVVLAILSTFFVSTYNRYQFIEIKITEAENNIDIFLQKKLDILSRAVPLLKEHLEDDIELFAKVLLLKSKKLTHFELYDDLKKYASKFYEIIDLHAKLEEVEPLIHLQVELEENEDNLEASTKYYNDNVIQFNHLVRLFPSNLVGIFCHYKEKTFYSQKKEEMFEILKEEKKEKEARVEEKPKKEKKKVKK